MRLYETYDELQYLWSECEGILTGAIKHWPDGSPIEDESQALDQLESALKEIEDERDEKAVRISCMVKNALAEAKALKEEKMRLQKRQQAAERMAERLKGYLSDFLEPGTQIKDARAQIGWRQSTVVDVFIDPEELPEEFRRVKTEADVTKIKQHLKADGTLAGCELVTKQNIQIR